MNTKKTTAPKVNTNRNELVKLIKRLSDKYSTWNVFEDFLAMSAYALSNSVDWVHREKREAQYMEVVGKYDSDEITLFPKMLDYLIEEMELNAEYPKDILGPVFHDLELHNKYKGQFFTPQSVCNMMGEISFGESGQIIAEKDYVTVAEPCAGSGAMILGFAQSMKKRGYNFQRQMVVTATDVDIKCVWMSYIQLALYNIPAVVIHGNSLTVEEHSRWYTPAYILGGWVWRQSCGNLDKLYPEDEAMKQTSEPMYAAVRKADALMNDTVHDKKILNNDSRQLSLDL